MNKIIKLNDGHEMYLAAFQAKTEHVQKELQAANINATVIGRNNDSDEFDLTINVEDDNHNLLISRALKYDRFKVMKKVRVDDKKITLYANLY